MIRLLLATSCALLSVLPTRAAGAQRAEETPAITATAAEARPAGDSLAVELLAARHILSRHAHARISLDPAYAPPATAPGQPTPRTRPPARTQLLADSLGARASSETAEDVVHLVLSEPTFDSDGARVTVTLNLRPSDRRWAFYETLLVHLRDDGGWRVERSEPLGIS